MKRWIVALAVSQAQRADDARNGARDFASPTEAIDTFIAEGWRRLGVTPSAPADDRTWCRRVYLDLAGRVPTREELHAFLYSPSEDKRIELVDRLIEADTYAVRMRELWDGYLMGRGGPRREDRRRDNGWWEFLENAFRENRPWNETVRDLLVARPQTPETRGATWFLYERRDSHQAIAEAVAPIVYGMQIDCAQCHDHPLVREIKQAHYWGLVAAFNRSKNVKGEGAVVGESAVGGFINFTNLEKESQPAKVVLLTGGATQEPWPEGAAEQEDSDDNYIDPEADVRVPKYSRRAEFAKLATADNPLLARAMVNRVWAVFLGRGVVHPVDQMSERNAASHPELLDWLADDFASNGYDVRRLVRAVVLSRVYGLAAAAHDAAPQTFAGALERPLLAEQVARSWRVALGLPADDDALRRAGIAAMPAVSYEDHNVSFQQAQFLGGHDELAELLATTNETVLRVLNEPDVDGRVRMAFLTSYGRWPDEDELSRVRQFLDAHRAAPEKGVRELLWALLTSPEFLTAP